MLAIDHVIFTVPDLVRAAARLEEEYGLASVPGGRHAGHGTGNRIIPLGPSYIELMAVVDDREAQGSPLATWVKDRTHGDVERMAALCLRTDDIEPWAEKLRTEPLPMSRKNHEGIELSWRLVGLDHALANPPLPFFIEWSGPKELHPGKAAAAHRIEPRGISWVELAGRSDEVRAFLGESKLDIRAVNGEPGISGLGVATSEGDIVLL